MVMMLSKKVWLLMTLAAVYAQEASRVLKSGCAIKYLQFSAGASPASTVVVKAVEPPSSDAIDAKEKVKKREVSDTVTRA